MRALAAILLLLAAGAAGQNSRPASAPSSGSDELLRMLASSVMQDRITKSMRDVAALGPLCGDEAAAGAAIAGLIDQMRSSGLEPISVNLPKSRGVAGWIVPLKSPTEHAPRLVSLLAVCSAETAAAAGALLECARVSQAMRKTGQIPSLSFEVGFELHLAADEPAWGLPPAKARVAEIRFGDLTPGQKESFSVTIASPAAAQPALADKIERVLKRFKGERGFWKDYEVRSEPGGVPKDGVPRITIGGSKPLAPASRPAGSRPASAPAKKDVQAAVHAARFALMLVAGLAE